MEKGVGAGPAHPVPAVPRHQRGNIEGNGQDLHLQKDKLLSNLNQPSFEVPKSIKLIYSYLKSSCVICIGLRVYGFLEDVVMLKYSHELNLRNTD